MSTRADSPARKAAPSPVSEAVPGRARRGTPGETPATAPASSPIAAAPLYRQVAERLADRIYDGVWSSGEPIPTEFALADEFAVSQGTVRKALATLESTGLVTRHQGRGTFVSDLGAERSRFHFFRLTRPDGGRVLPEPGTERLRLRRATREERRRFGDDTLERVHEIRRVRLAEGVRTLSERIVLPEPLFEGLERWPRPLPDALYPFYHQAFGRFVLGVEEQVAATLASGTAARELGVAPGTPLLRIGRVAHDPKRRVLELRASHCLTERLRYRVELS